MSTKKEKRAKNRQYQALHYSRKKAEGKTLVKIWVTPEEKEFLRGVIKVLPDLMEQKRKKSLSPKP
jgi:hypothetical protein